MFLWVDFLFAAHTEIHLRFICFVTRETHTHTKAVWRKAKNKIVNKLSNDIFDGLRDDFEISPGDFDEIIQARN